jgi:hypothetical protein
VVVRAANPGKAVLAAGSAMVVKKSAHVVVDGLTFLGGANTMLKLESSNNVRVTHNTFDRGGSGEGSSKWLYVGGADSHHNRIDHNTFRNKTDSGNYLTLDGSETQVSQYDRIDHNRFLKIGPRAENEKGSDRGTVPWVAIHCPVAICHPVSPSAKAEDKTVTKANAMKLVNSTKAISGRSASLTLPLLILAFLIAA